MMVAGQAIHRWRKRVESYLIRNEMHCAAPGTTSGVPQSGRAVGPGRKQATVAAIDEPVPVGHVAPLAGELLGGRRAHHRLHLDVLSKKTNYLKLNDPLLYGNWGGVFPEMRRWKGYVLGALAHNINNSISRSLMVF